MERARRPRACAPRFGSEAPVALALLLGLSCTPADPAPAPAFVTATVAPTMPASSERAPAPTASAPAAAPSVPATTSATVPARSLGPNALPGTYDIEKNPSIGAELVVTSVSPLSFDLAVVRKRPSAPHGELKGASATVLDDATAVFVSEEDCKITLRFERAKIVVKQEGDCGSAGFGVFVDASGTYLKKSK